MNILFDELGIKLANHEWENLKLFKFIHQTHKTKFKDDKDLYEDSPFEVVEKYNESYKKLFMTDSLCSRMFYMVFKNYVHEYCLLIKPRYRKDITITICMLLN